MKSIASRIARQSTRIRESVCPLTIQSIVRSMTSELDPEAIPALILLLDHKHDSKDSVTLALLRYGESAEDSLRALVATAGEDNGARRIAAEDVLARMALRDRLLQVGCF